MCRFEQHSFEPIPVESSYVDKQVCQLRCSQTFPIDWKKILGYVPQKIEKNVGGLVLIRCKVQWVKNVKPLF